MDVNQLSTAKLLMGSKISSNIGIAVFKLVQDTVIDSGDMVVDMIKAMETSVNPHIGSSVDISL